ncbi:radical SAM domain-containing protein [Chondrocystis sp. NIES-4102]|nr:radical SAM domain-containing protein [Chondrocystis sp. NIES-4102]
MNSVVTYSPAYTIVSSYECFNRCSYCNFRVDLETESPLRLESSLEKLQNIDRKLVTEILVISGEVHPQSLNRLNWLEKIYRICQMCLDLGFLPHTNVGPLSFQEMSLLKSVNVSMGLMLEQVNPKFQQTVHKHAPSKDPALRLEQLEWAGKLKIPFTTGLLLGIGETYKDIQESLEAIARSQRRWGHIQEVILQPHSLGSSQEEINLPSFDLNLLPGIITEAKKILPETISIQIPPNLVFEANFLIECIVAGARDLGGISPKDEVNPDYPHPTYQALSAILQPAGWTLKPRLPVYPQYYSWLSPNLQTAIEAKKNLI